MWTAYKKSSDLQGNVLSSWGITPESKNEKESSWVKVDYGKPQFDVTRQITSTKGESQQDSLRRLKGNVAFLRIIQGSKFRTCRLLCLVGNKYLTTNHSLPDDETMRCEVVMGYKRRDISESHWFVLHKKDIQRHVSKDLAVITINSLPPKSDITKYFHPKSMSNMYRGPAFYFSMSKNNDTEQMAVPYTEIRKDCNNTDLNITYDAWFSDGIVTHKGDCGATLCASTDIGFMILGVHQAFTSKQAVAIDVSIEDLEVFDLDSIKPGKPLLGTKDKPIEIKDQPSITESLQSGTLIDYGTIQNRVYPRSNVKPTLLCDDMKNLGFPLEHGPPVFQGKQPWMINLEQQIQADCSVDSETLDEITSQMLDDWLTLLPDTEKLEVYDMFTVVNGIPGLRYIDSINRSSSMGFPWSTTKRTYLTELPPIDEYQDPVMFTDEVLERVEERLSSYLRGERTYPIFKASLKDEALPFRKIESKKTRVFMAAPIDFTLVMRSVLLSFVRLSQKNRYIFESAPGLEAQTSEWDELYHYLTKFGDSKMIFGDFSGFDVTMRSNFLLSAFKLIEDFHRARGFDEKYCRVIRCIAYDVTFPVVNYNGALIELFGKNPSGQALTVTINSILIACICDIVISV